VKDVKITTESVNFISVIFKNSIPVLRNKTALGFENKSVY